MPHRILLYITNQIFVTYCFGGHNKEFVVECNTALVLCSGQSTDDSMQVLPSKKCSRNNCGVAEMMMSVLWYYRPEHTETERLPQFIDSEIFASKHRDAIPVACVDDKCHVLTFNQYCR